MYLFELMRFGMECIISVIGDTDCKERFSTMQGYAKRWMFPNGLGVSIVSHKDCIGGGAGEFEGALLVRRKIGVGEYRIAEVFGPLTFTAVDEVLVYVDRIPQEDADEIVNNIPEVLNYHLRKIVGIRETYRISRRQDRLNLYSEPGNLTH
jgi:hypothetical protein